jgi:hypothetical protein
MADENEVLRLLERPEQPDVSASDIEAERVVVYALAVGQQPAPGAQDERLLFVRKSDPRYNVSRRVIALWDNTLKAVDEPLLSFDRNVDLVLAPRLGIAAINGNAFELLFRETPELLARTPEFAGRIADNVPMTSAARLSLEQAAVKYARVRRRLIAIVERGHLKGVTTRALRAELVRQELDPSKYLLKNELTFG